LEAVGAVALDLKQELRDHGWVSYLDVLLEESKNSGSYLYSLPSEIIDIVVDDLLNEPEFFSHHPIKDLGWREEVSKDHCKKPVKYPVVYFVMLSLTVDIYEDSEYGIERFFGTEVSERDIAILW
jgi:hypothetical protein